MVTQELLDYIQGEVARGVNQGRITQALLAIGWSSEDVQEAFASLLGTKAVSLDPSSPPQSSTTTTKQASLPSGEKTAQIETVYSEAVAKVAKMGEQQREAATGFIKTLEQRKLDEVKSRLGMS